MAKSAYLLDDVDLHEYYINGSSIVNQLPMAGYLFSSYTKSNKVVLK